MDTNDIDRQEILDKLATNGAYFIPNAFNPDFCKSIINWFDNNADSLEHESHYDNTEIRIYGSECFNSDIQNFKKYSDALLTKIYGKNMYSYSILAIRNKQLENNGLHLDNRWHIDSFRKQIKTFLFLNDTDVNSGAFEYFPKSNSIHFKINMAVRGIYFRFSDLIRGTRAYTCVQDSAINSLSKASFAPNKVIVKSGTLVIADTSTLHRASPCISGYRYALTSYYK